MTRFWEDVALADMTRDQWESLCDGCAKCCLIKLIDEDAPAGSADETVYTNVACRLLDRQSCRCVDYPARSEKVPGCVTLTVERLPEVAGWLPGTCAYRLLFEGQSLPVWHPLISGDPDSVHAAGISLREQMDDEARVRDADLEDHVISRARIDFAPDLPRGRRSRPKARAKSRGPRN